MVRLAGHLNVRLGVLFLVLSDCSVVMGFLAQERDSSAPKPLENYTIAEVRAGIVAYCDQFLSQDSFFVDYEIADSEEFLKSKFATHESGFHFVNARKNDWWYSWLQGSEKPLRSKHDLTSVFRDGLGVELHGGVMMIDSDPVGSPFERWYYTDHLWLNIYEDLPEKIKERAARAAKLPLLPESTASPDYQILAPQDVAGVPCIVLDRPGYNRIFVAPSRDFIPIKTEWRFRHKEAGNPLRTVVYNEDLRVVSGIWVPYRQIVEFYPNPDVEDKSIWGKRASRWTVLVKRLEFNTLDDSFFSITAPVGTFVRDFVRDKKYVVEGGNQNHFESAISFVKAEAKIMPQTAKWNWALILLGTFMLTVTAYLIVKKRRI